MVAEIWMSAEFWALKFKFEFEFKWARYLNNINAGDYYQYIRAYYWH